MKKIIHYPNLKTVLMVEDMLKKSNALLTREKIKQNLKKKMMHQTLNVILEYLEKDGKIIDGRKGILWVHNPSSKLEKAIKSGMKI
jgi:hypothetical protein